MAEQPLVPIATSNEGTSSSRRLLFWRKKEVKVREYPPFIPRRIDEESLRGARLIEDHGPSIINQRGKTGLTLTHYLVSTGKLDLALKLFDYASDIGVNVVLTHDHGDLLGDELNNGSLPTVKFVLENLVAQIASVEETARVLKLNLSKLLDRCPDLVEQCLIGNKFVFEEGSFLVPASLFKGGEKAPLYFITDEVPKWEPLNSDQLASAWEKNSQVGEAMKDADVYKVEAVSKFVCIEDFANNMQSIFYSEFNMLALLNKAQLSMEVFRSETIFSLVQSKWLDCRSTFAIGIFIQIVSAVLLISFFITTDYSNSDEEEDVESGGSAADIISLVLLLSFFLLEFMIGVYFMVYRDFIRAVIAFLPLAVFFVFLANTSYTIFAISLSAAALILWTKILMSIRPFDHIGPYVSIFVRTFIDIVPFFFIGMAVLFSFGTVLAVVSRGRDHEVVSKSKNIEYSIDKETWYSDDLLNTFQYEKIRQDVEINAGQNPYEDVDYTYYVLESIKTYDMRMTDIFTSLFYAMVAGANSNKFTTCGKSDACLTPFVFGFFLFVGNVMLLTLLVSVLGDSYNREITNRKSSVTKSRSEISILYGNDNFKGLPLICCICCPICFFTCRRKSSSNDSAWKKKYFHYLVPKQYPSKDEGSDSPGGQSETKQSSSRQDEMPKSQSKDAAAEGGSSSDAQLRNTLEELKAQHHQDVDHLQKRIDALTSQIERLADTLGRQGR